MRASRLVLRVRLRSRNGIHLFRYENIKSIVRSTSDFCRPVSKGKGKGKGIFFPGRAADFVGISFDV